ncbi:SipW-dependent-type signal peptide-containing protein [Caproiciproducens sp.]
MIRKSAFISVLLVILTVGMLGGATSAYFTDTQAPQAEITTGNAAIKVIKTESGSKKEGGCHKDGMQAEASDYQTECLPDCWDGSREYYAVWTIRNMGSTPVTLRAKLSQKWDKEKPCLPILTRQPAIDPKPVDGWSLKNSVYSYVTRSKNPDDLVVVPGGEAVFKLKFQVKGGGILRQNYKLKLNLDVMATQVTMDAGYSTMDADESPNGQGEKQPPQN